eukprot:CAMPEP_0173453570 /NCGR_PEP_ID=MMETSP1357-20121228/50855_1 /TAXON_ID=77926 /ORGANISM="Hemiselmis rufescens, Strain PCC563" /LENGTH=216 /DNA_ID=CAMNT_0014420537 /DNA_START=180 /DNA_END=826 /DNA_ORIENTATION=-
MQEKRVRPVLGADGLEFVVENYSSGGRSLCRCPELTPRRTPPQEGHERPAWMPPAAQDAWVQFLSDVRAAVRTYRNQGLYDRYFLVVCLALAGGVVAGGILTKANMITARQLLPLHASVPVVGLAFFLLCLAVRWSNAQVDFQIDLLCLEASKSPDMQADIMYHHYTQRNWGQASSTSRIALTTETYKAVFVRPQKELKFASHSKSGSSSLAESPL